MLNMPAKNARLWFRYETVQARLLRRCGNPELAQEAKGRALRQLERFKKLR